MKPFALALLLAVTGFLAAAELGSEAFLERTRFPSGQASYAMLDGVIQHRRDGGKMEEYPVYFGVMISGPRSRSELLIDNREGYLVERIAGSGGKVTMKVDQLSGEIKDPVAKRFHLKAEDLATGFLFYHFLREDAAAVVRGIPCRVLVLEAPDKSEIAKVFIARDYYFPLKVEFYPDAKLAGEPERTLETASFKKENELYYAELLNLYGSGWRTRIQFSAAKVGVPDPDRPQDIFRKAK